MTIPRYQKGQPLRAADLNLLSDAVARARVLPGVGIKLTETVNGTVVSLKPSRSSGAAPVERQPWDIIDLVGVGAVDPTTGKFSTYHAKVQPGLVAGILPSNWDSVFTLGAGLHYAAARIQTDGTGINAVEIKVTTTPPPISTPEKWKLPTVTEILFAVISAGEAKRTIGPGNINVSPQIWVTIPKTTPVGPGELAYDRYYILA